MRRIFTIATALLVGLAACGDDPADPNGGNGNGNGGPPNGTMTAQIDGQSWSAISIIATYDGELLVIGGADANVTGIGIGSQGVDGPGTYVIGTVIGANGSVTQDGTMIWFAGIGVGSGSITVSSISAVGAVGTFAFVAEPSMGGATGTRVVTNGTFNVTF